jgi:hypothetical protein
MARTTTTTNSPAPAPAPADLTKMVLSVYRKISDNAYGSFGASAEITLMLPSNQTPEACLAYVQINQANLARLVDDHLTKWMDTSQKQARIDPAASNGRINGRVEPGDDQPEDDDDDRVTREFDDNPRTNGVALLKKCSEASDKKLKARLFNTGRALHFPAKFTMWTAEQCDQVHSLLFPEEEPNTRKKSRIPF